MADIIAPPSLNLGIPGDPGGGALGAASHAYAAGLQFATALKDQALKGQQQQDLVAHQAQMAADKKAFDLSNQQFKLAQAGAVMDGTGGGQSTAPSSTPGMVNAQGQTGLQVRPGAVAADPTDQSGNRIVQQPGGPDLSGANGYQVGQQPGGPDPSGAPSAPDAPSPTGGASMGTLDEALRSGGQQGLPTSATAAPDSDFTRITDLGGTNWKFPGLKSRQAQTESGKPSFVPDGPISTLLQANGWKPGQPLEVGQAAGLVGALNAAQPKASASQFFQTTDADGTVHILQADKTKGSATEVGTFPGAGKPSAEKTPPKPAYGYHTDDSGKVSVTRTGGDDDTPQIWKGGQWTPMGDSEAVGPKRKDPDIAGALLSQHQQDAKDAQNTALDTQANATATKYQKQENDAHAQREVYGPAFTAKDGSKIPDPDDKNGRTVTVTPALRARWKAAFDKATADAITYNKAKRTVITGRGGDPGPALDFGAPTKTNPPAAGQQTSTSKTAAPAPPAPQTPAPAAAPPAQKPAAATPQSRYTEGQTATGPSGAKLIFKGGQWLPLTTK